MQGTSFFYQANILYCNILIRNIFSKEDKSNDFLINLDFAINISWLKMFKAPKKTGTKVFIAIDFLYSNLYTFMHGLKLFF